MAAPGATPGAVRCLACGHRCLIPSGRQGICKVRFNDGGTLMVPGGYVSSLACDPIEKKPFFHVLPGADAMSFGMLGCDLHCPYCQNWDISQVGRDPEAAGRLIRIAPERIVETALQRGARVIASTYNEPLISSEWAVTVFRLARQAGLRTAYVSNGNATPEVLRYLRPWLDLYKVDLKSFRDGPYRQLGATLETVKRTLLDLHELGYWIEVVTLVVPGFNDSDDEIRDAARFLASISPAIPWHLTAFHGDYQRSDVPSTRLETLLRLRDVAAGEGIGYIYIGNVAGRLRGGEDTQCHACRATLVRRAGFRVLENRLRAGRCPDCGAAIPGVWD